MIIYIYKNTTLIAKPQAETIEEFKKNPTGFYPAWAGDLIASAIEFRYPKLADGVLTEKTIEELKIEGLDPLIDGEKIVDNKLVTVPKIEGLKVVWNGSEWVETATQEEIDKHFLEQDKAVALRIHNDHVLGINVTDEEWSEVVEYIQAVNSEYVEASNIKLYTTIKRPSIFDRYV